MIEYARPSVDNLINNLPDELKSSRQFLAWNLEATGKKVPLKEDGSSWGNYRDTTCWRTFDIAIDLLDRRQAFGIGLVLPSPQQIETLPEFNLIAGLIAFDGDAKRSSQATPYQVPPHLVDYVYSAQSYSEFSTSLKGLRALAFGNLPTSKQHLRKSFGDGTELSLYQGGWVTLSGLAYGDSPPTIEHRQEVLDQIIQKLWQDLTAGTAAAAKKPANPSLGVAALDDSFVLDWGRSANENLIRRFIQGLNRTPKQLRDITDTWELKRGWDHGTTPDSSMYTKRIVEEALWLRPLLGWTPQDVIDIVITFCRKHQLRLSAGRLKKQISDGQRFILSKTSLPRLYVSIDGFPCLDQQQHPATTLTCNGSQIILELNTAEGMTLTGTEVSGLPRNPQPQSTDTLQNISGVDHNPKLSTVFRHKSVPRAAVLEAISKYSSWVKVRSVAAETGLSRGAARKQLQRLEATGLVDRNGKGLFRKHRERKPRKLKPCSAKAIPLCQGTTTERRTLSPSELLKRGWPRTLIEQSFPEAGKDYVEKEVVLESPIGRVIRARYYWVSRIKAIELQPWFEMERFKKLNRS